MKIILERLIFESLKFIFNHNNGVEYNQNEDRPYHIQKGSTGGRKTELIGYFTKIMSHIF